MPEFFIRGYTFAAPFVSEEVARYVEAEGAGAALESLAAQMHDGIGLFAAEAFISADAFHKGAAPVARWLSNKARAIEGAGSIYSSGPGHVTLNGDRDVIIDDPKAGSLVGGDARA